MLTQWPKKGSVGQVATIEINECTNRIHVQLIKTYSYTDGSGSTRPDTSSARESTRPRVNSAGSTRPLVCPITGGVFYKCMKLLDMNNDF